MGEFTNTLHEAIEAGLDIGLESYPIFSEAYRDTLNDKIIAHYYDDELGFEDESKFVRRLNNKMIEIMPLYNQMYESELLTINPLLSFSKTDTAESSNSITGSGTLSSSQNRTTGVEETATSENAQNNSNRINNKEIVSDTPQGLLTINDIDGSVYASNASLSEQLSAVTGTNQTENNLDRAETEAQTTENENTSTSTGESESNATSSGYDRPLTELLKMYRETFLNVDMLVIKDLEVCFMGLY